MEENKEKDYDIGQSDNKSGKGMGWYVVHTYSGYEKKVQKTIEKTVENQKLQEVIREVVVPIQEVVETKNDGKKIVPKKIFPGYVLIHMDADNNEAWYVVRNTRGVTGFVGPGSKPVPLTDEELGRFLNLDGNTLPGIDAKEGDIITVIAGVWKDNMGPIKRIDEGKRTVTISVDVFGRETPVEIGFDDIKKM